ncbi:MAG: 2'-5' RNA ligase [Caldithrix sp. RBG_13_44_9]|nr:MAG: 2'-5' RNA ligase [Caldithrix sp. RBG_13_44_9]
MNKNSDSEKIRTFIAIPLPPSVTGELKKLLAQMKSFSKGIKWVNPESIHLTLKFLGNLSAGELSKVFTGMQNIFQDPPSGFRLTAAELGAFPSLKKPRVFWVGVSGSGMETLIQLQKLIEDEMYRQGFPREERKFSPHLTLSRIKFADRLTELTQAFSSYNFPAVEFMVSEILIMRSELRPEGAVYSIQQKFALSLG